ncbi:MAG: dethiobiotin synthetase [Rickettsiales bacterium]|jgi:dethiobiotin synthetase
MSQINHLGKIFFVTGTGTDIGKTFILSKICQKLIKEGNKVSALKPVISGFEKGDSTSDSAKILQVLGQDFTPDNINKISPYRFKAAISPNIAAGLENKNINFEELVEFCKNSILEAKENDEYLFIEGAGGVMTPINNQKTFADLIAELKIPAILVTGNYLGTISHTLTAIKALESNKIKISKIIFNKKEGETDDFGNLETLRKFTDIEIFC